MMRDLLLHIVLIAMTALPLASAQDTVTQLPVSVPAARSSSPELTFSLTAGIDGEIFPVFANYLSLRGMGQRKWGTIAVFATNTGNVPAMGRLAVNVPGWSDTEVQAVQLDPRESRTYLFAPSFLARFYRNNEIAAATAQATLTDEAGQVLSTQTLPVHIRSAQDMYWGTKFEYASFITSWITPHDPEVERILSEAKEFMTGRRLPGYDPSKPELQETITRDQARAIYQALQHAGISYVKSSMTLGDHSGSTERVRMPWQSLRDVSANCIDGVVLYASLFENLGMDTRILLVPGHAYVGVRLSPKSPGYLYIETAIIGRASYEEAIASAERGVAAFKGREIAMIDVPKTRSMGIYPMPSPVAGEQHLASQQLGLMSSHPRSE